MACGKWYFKNTEGTGQEHAHHMCDDCGFVDNKGRCSVFEWQASCFNGSECHWKPKDE